MGNGHWTDGSQSNVVGGEVLCGVIETPGLLTSENKEEQVGVSTGIKINIDDDGKYEEPKRSQMVPALPLHFEQTHHIESCISFSPLKQGHVFLRCSYIVRIK